MLIILSEQIICQLLERKSEFDEIKEFANTILEDIQRAVTEGGFLEFDKRADVYNNVGATKPVIIKYENGFNLFPRKLFIIVEYLTGTSNLGKATLPFQITNKSEIKGTTKIKTKISEHEPMSITLYVSAWFKDAMMNKGKWAMSFKKDLMSSIGDVLVHELQHAVDFYKHKGMAKFDSRNIRKTKKDYTQYVRTNDEINAHLSQTLHTVERLKLKFATPKEYVKIVTQQGKDWYPFLTPKQQKAVIGKIVAYWHEEYGDIYR